MPQKRTTHRKTTSGRRTSPVPHRRPNVFIRLLQHMPGWAWWIGGAVVSALYIYFFYYFFISPFGFRFRALYGDISYPEGYEIHGIDIRTTSIKPESMDLLVVPIISTVFILLHRLRLSSLSRMSSWREVICHPFWM